MAASSPALVAAAVVRATCCSAAASVATESGGTAEVVLFNIATAARAPTAVSALQATQPDPMLDCFSAALMCCFAPAGAPGATSIESTSKQCHALKASAFARESAPE
eukprot:10171567-Karenia_brevis.AAC.1